MDKGILNEVIAAEKSIQESVEAEQAKLRQRLDEVRRECEAALVSASGEQDPSGDDGGREPLTEAERQAAKLIADAQAEALRMEQVDDGILAAVIMKRLSRVLME